MTTVIAIASAHASIVSPDAGQEAAVPGQAGQREPSTADGSGKIVRADPAGPQGQLGGTEHAGQAGRAEVAAP